MKTSMLHKCFGLGIAKTWLLNKQNILSYILYKNSLIQDSLNEIHFAYYK